jgi:hypothetical protein
MPRLSLYKPERGQDYKFIDRQISEMFQVGATDVYLHKYIGSNTSEANATADQPHYATTSVTNIQDLLFLENRDRKYDSEIYRIRGLYNVQNIDFNLSQFGLFIDNDTLFMTVHINDFIKYIGRKPISGDVMEMPHLRDQFALNDFEVGLPRYYVIEDVGRASEGFSSTWYPHLYRLKLRKVTDNQQFADIFNKPILDANGDPLLDSSGNLTGQTLRDLLSTHNKELAVNDTVIAQAEADTPKSGYETRQFYTLAVDAQGKPILNTADSVPLLGVGLDASNATITAQESNARPVRTGYTGYLVGDGFPANGYEFGHGIQFPESAIQDDFFLRTDFLPNRLFRYQENRWIKVEDAVRMTLTNNNTRQTLKTGFINNTDSIYNQQIAVDAVILTAGAYVINTTINYIEAPYIMIKQSITEIGFTVADYPDQVLISSYLVDTVAKVRITLPLTNLLDPTTQQTIPYAEVWQVGLYNNKEEVRQSLSKALRPKADL